MYHLLFDRQNAYILVRDTDYKCSNWGSVEVALIWNEKTTTHWDQPRSAGKPITECIHNYALISSFETIPTKESHPELFI